LLMSDLLVLVFSLIMLYVHEVVDFSAVSLKYVTIRNE
jgi:hypothetical protein